MKADCVVLIHTVLESEAVLDQTSVVLNVFKVSRPDLAQNNDLMFFVDRNGSCFSS